MSYIQDKLDEVMKNIELGGNVKANIEKALTDYHNHIVEMVDKLNKNAEKFVPFQKIHYQSALTDLKYLLQDTNQKE